MAEGGAQSFDAKLKRKDVRLEVGPEGLTVFEKKKKGAQLAAYPCAQLRSWGEGKGNTVHLVEVDSAPRRRRTSSTAAAANKLGVFPGASLPQRG
eukprot:COSAG04_NODE_2962_length_3342_cov_2.461918_3_plen_95_part_00